MTTDEKLTKFIGHFLSGFAMSKAITEDYARVVSKLEGVDEQEVKDRINKRTAEIFEEVKKELKA